MAGKKLFQELEFKDAFLFALTMEEEEICRGVLERILEMDLLCGYKHCAFCPAIRMVFLDKSVIFIHNMVRKTYKCTEGSVFSF